MADHHAVPHLGHHDRLERLHVHGCATTPLRACATEVAFEESHRSQEV
jgi:hypothetical protein